jgi:hypothetical protein
MIVYYIFMALFFVTLMSAIFMKDRVAARTEFITALCFLIAAKVEYLIYLQG